MEHLLIPQGAQHDIITVPFKSNEGYDGGDFATYPLRKGWSPGHLHGEDQYGGRSPEEVESFFQTWLFFGCLLEVFKIGGISVSTDDFIDRNRCLVTTNKLPALFVEWQKRWPKPTPSPECKCYINYPKNIDCNAQPCWKSFNIGSHSPEYPKIMSVLDIVRRTMGYYSYNPRGSRKPGAIAEVVTTLIAPMSQEIMTSIIAMGFILRAAIFDIYDIPQFQRENDWGSTLLLRSLLKEKWCPAHVTTMMQDLNIDGHYYVALTPGLSETERQAHLNCQDRACVAGRLDKATYRNKHVTEDCQCDMISIPEEQAIKIIKSKGTPILYFTQGSTPDQKSCLTVADYNSEKGRKPKYIAISHVWSDGMGNPKENKLPECILSMIQKAVDNVHFSHRDKTSSHIGFWMDTLCVPVRKELEEYRKLCIVNMRHTYEDAAAVLVLESSLQRLSSLTPIPDICLGLYHTKWRRRLWTYQEGALPRRLFLQLCDKSQRIGDLAKERLQKEKALAAQGVYTFFLAAAESEVTWPMSFMSGLLHRWKEQGSTNMGSVAFNAVNQALLDRQTTRKSDETLCIATSVNINPSFLLEVEGHDDQDVADQRMELLLRHIEHFSPALIFDERPKLPRDGFRWAPRSLMGSGRIYNRSINTDSHSLLSLHNWGPGDSNIGFKVQFTGLALESIRGRFDSPLPRTFLVADKLKSVVFNVQLLPDENGLFPVWRAGKYYLVLGRMINLPNALTSIAALVRPSTGPQGGHQIVRHECIAWVEKRAEPLGETRVETIELIPESTWIFC